MATLIDERPVEELDNEQEVADQVTEEPQLEETPQEQQEEIPDKYKGKSTAEIVRMHQEAEKLLGRQSSEVGELRKVVDDYIQTQLDTTTQAPQEAEEDIDFFSDPDKAVERAIKNHPSIKAAEATKHSSTSNRQRSLTCYNVIPTCKRFCKMVRFVDWIKGSKIRTQLFAQADTQYDYEAADELFSLWKERQQAVGQTVAQEKASRKEAVKTASTGGAKGSGETASRKVYRRSDIIKLMQDDPDRYLSLSDEIMQAYAEGRVRN